MSMLIWKSLFAGYAIFWNANQLARSRRSFHYLSELLIGVFATSCFQILFLLFTGSVIKKPFLLPILKTNS